MPKKISKKISLIIVESPTKAKTLANFLNGDFLVESCNGHVRDLPKGKMGINIEQGFQPEYVIPTKKRKLVNNLKKIAAKANSLYYATDSDREGEAIAWHLSQALQSESQDPPTDEQKFYRISFHEITEEAIKQALKNPRSIDLNLVNAQQARRILDRLVGYELSPLLWKKLVKGLSAGRVQSPTVRLIVEREREIEKFKPEEYWSVVATLLKSPLKANPPLVEKINTFEAKLYKIGDKIISRLDVKTKKEVDEIVGDLKKSEYQVLDIKNRQINKPPLPPFTTSTLQQQANKELNFSTKQTMLLAQRLYEGVALEKKRTMGLITYHRTDSLNLAEEFLRETGQFISDKYGQKYLNIKHYKTKSKMAQEAHEAIRPTSCSREPEKIKKFLDNNQYKLYDLIWRRTLCSQMSSALVDAVSVNIEAKKIDNNQKTYILRTNGSNLSFDGWLKLYPKKQVENHLPHLSAEEKLDLIKVNADQHFTEPPARYNEASLVKTLEQYGIGRPSTYAPIISTIQERNYVQKEQGSFRPTEIGVLVNDLLLEHFPNIVDYQFTAQMENNLDKIANGQIDCLEMIGNFYFPFKQILEQKEKEIAKKFESEKTEKKCPECGQNLIIKMGRFGKFLACSGFPKCRYTKTLEQKQINAKLGIKCSKCQKGEIIKKRTKNKRFFYGCSRWPQCDFATWKNPATEHHPVKNAPSGK